ncbi:hypothetical protein A1Q1_07916 [Trichosporon asahii var. asahii CBS 2479]|uniref:Uncharacterized protein n=1 Tax=Trichosporon asahii var. asahii (strain ATCC 90039 / CBS 2479 / JCM 2466 / KCTC 7840 / NBRC 103889/ NCYC 2677 / UAMH 7654) TaxID=1186058 RepID=J5R6G1_TRIAS|nr:hypothetical protein A1Q1_07916 [Trichosporon asahii var. asahii CBS 2479]EJT50943.1 hypothetical protein A1Q1_07916 [Trichosporon asahii var. asahii CBS 2479]
MLATPRIKLTPVAPTLGNPDQVRSEETTIILRKNAWDWGDTDGYTIVVASATPGSARDKMEVLNEVGTHLYDIKNRISVHRTMQGKRDQHEFFEVQNEKTQKVTTDHESVMTGWWKDTSGTRRFAIKGNWYKGEAVVWLSESNHPIGTILTADSQEGYQRVGGETKGEEDYQVRVAPGVDLQVFAGICIAAETILAKAAK